MPPQRIGEYLLELFSTAPGGMLVVSHLFHDDVNTFDAAFYQEKMRRHCARDTLHDALQLLVRDEDQKTCNTCQRSKRLSEFARCRNTPDGRLYNCRVCERIRVAEYKRRKQRERVRAAAQVTQA